MDEPWATALIVVSVASFAGLVWWAIFQWGPKPTLPPPAEINRKIDAALGPKPDPSDSLSYKVAEAQAGVPTSTPVPSHRTIPTVVKCTYLNGEVWVYSGAWMTEGNGYITMCGQSTGNMRAEQKRIYPTAGMRYWEHTSGEGVIDMEELQPQAVRLDA